MGDVAIRKEEWPPELQRKVDELYKKYKFLEHTNPHQTVFINVDTEDWVVGEDSNETWARFIKRFGERKHVAMFILGSCHSFLGTCHGGRNSR